MGPSGSGKSTLLYNVSGMDDPDTGEVVLGNTVITDLSEDEKGELRLGKYIQLGCLVKSLTFAYIC
jgi:putative ABC transport system ATP-binding protein